MSLQANNITFKYFPKAKKNTLENIHLEVKKGKITMLVGKSGSGKSTLAYVLSGLYPNELGALVQGSITIDGVDIASLTPDKRVKKIALMFQNPDLQFCMNTPLQELQFCLENIDTKEELMLEIIDNVLKQLNITHLKNRSFQTMSGGEKQKCALACILALESEYIILDEAFANIDPKSAKEIINFLPTLGVTVLVIDHDLTQWEGIYDEIISLDGSSSLPILYNLPNYDTCTEIIKAQNLTIENIKYPDFTIKKGSINAIVGQSGSGKTTLFKTMIKQFRYEGFLQLNGVEIRKIKQKKLFQKIGIVFQNPANQFLAMTVYEEVYFSINQWYKSSTLAQKKQKTLDLLQLFQLESYKSYAPYMLSQGGQRRLAVLTMIAGAQEILILDEPTYGQDYENIKAIMDLLSEKTKSGLTIIFATHNLQFARGFSHQIITMPEVFHD